MRISFAFFLLLSITLLKAQTGTYFLSHYAPADEKLDYTCFDMVQDERGVMYFATRTGIMQFDGLNWDVVEGGNGAVYALEVSSRGDIFWAGTNGFGRLAKGSDGTLLIEKLSKPEDVNVYQVLTVKDQIYFLNDNAIFTLSPDGKISPVRSEKMAGSFTLLFELFGLPYVGTNAAGNYRIDQGKITPSSFNLPGKAEINFATRFENHYLIGSTDHLYLCSENLTVREVVIQNEDDREYINASVVIDAAWVNRHLVALATLRGGIIFINPFTGRTEQIIDYNAGLPDNEVFALMCDNDKNIWAAHDYGFTRISPFLPFRSFSHYHGLQGNLLCARTFENQVYAGTSLGLFKLVREDVYEDIVYYEDVEVKTPAQQDQPSQTEKETTSPKEEKKKGFLRFLKRRDKEETVAENNPSVSTERTSAEVVTKRQKRTKKILRSSNYVYKKVTGVEAKVTHLSEVQGKLIASGLAGVFEIDGLNAKSILEEPARFTYSYKSDLLLISTYDNSILALRSDGKRLVHVPVDGSINDQITFIFEGDNELFFSSLNKLYRFREQDGTLKQTQAIDLQNPNFSKVAGVYWNNNIIIANAEGFFNFDESNNLIRIDSLSKPKAYFAAGTDLWYHDGHNWNVLGQSAKQSNTHLLNIFQELRFISADVQTDNMWIITGSNELFKFFGEKLSIHNAEYPLFVKSVRHAEKKLTPNQVIKIVQEEGILAIEIVKPSFAGARASEYRYLMKGLNDDWSEWSHSNNELSFLYLPPGNYTLLAQSRDAFGVTSSMAPLDIEVLPPYWKRPWFYAMEFSVFAMLVMLSFRLSVRYRFISRLLSLLTIILLIEFIQTIAGYTFSTNSSPVLDFMIQVLVACLVLPIEGYLRNVMLRSMNTENRLYKIISGTHKTTREKTDVF